MLQLQVLDPAAGNLAIKVPDLLTIQKPSVEPGETFQAIWGSGYDSARAFVELISSGKVLQQYWTDPKATQVLIKQPVDESLRGGFHLRVTMVRENRIYQHVQFVDVLGRTKS